MPNHSKKNVEKHPKSSSNQSLNVDASAIKELATILKETDLTEIEYETEVCRIRVAKHGIPMPMSTQTVAPAANIAPVAAAIPEEAPVQNLSQHPGLIKAPMVGTVYLSAQPGAAAFVSEGTTVKEGDTLLIIEAMKVMNPIRAHKAGVVKSILVSDSEPVEFDHGLIIIE